MVEFKTSMHIEEQTKQERSERAVEKGAKNPLLMKDMLRQKQNRNKYLLDQRLRMGVFLAPESP